MKAIKQAISNEGVEHQNLPGEPLLNAVKTWFVAARPHTLSAAAVPVAVGGALAVYRGAFSWDLFALTLIASLLVQVGANFTDEFADHGATASRDKYPAPHKVIARGLLTARAVKGGAVAVFGMATAIGIYLVVRSGWPLLVLCLVSLAVAYLYSAGPLPLGDLALGEPLVFVVMGPLMVLGTVFVQTHAWDALALWHSLPVGALVTAILVANNLRDAEEDRANGRRTVVTVFGKPALGWGYRGLLGLSFAFPAAALAMGLHSPWALLPWLSLPLAWRNLRLLTAGGERAELHRMLKGSSALHLAFGVLLAASLLLERFQEA